MKLTEHRIVSPEKIIGVYARRPRQGTLRRWPKAARAIELLILGQTSDLSWENLDSSQQETFCAEFLRLPEAKKLGLPTLKFLLLPVGRTLKAIDIYGLSDTGSKIFAQVTNHHYGESEIKPKIESLKKYGGEMTELVLFCDVEKYQHEGGLHVVPLKTVFETLEKNELGRVALAMG